MEKVLELGYPDSVAMSLFSFGIFNRTPPTAGDMRAFADRFSAEEWWIISRSREFCDLLSTDIRAARPLAERLLRDWNKKRETIK